MVDTSLSQRKILEYLTERPRGATLDQLAELLGVTRTAAAMHVGKVVDLGLAGFEDAKGSVGRPRRSYLITEQGLESFPKQYAWLSTVLLSALAGRLGRGGLKRFMGGLAETVAQTLAQDIQGATRPQRMDGLVKVLNGLGYRASLRSAPSKGPTVIEATHCVYHSVAKEHPELCHFDLRLMEKLSGMDAELSACIAKGGHVCRFQLQPLAPKAR